MENTDLILSVLQLFCLLCAFYSGIRALCRDGESKAMGWGGGRMRWVINLSTARESSSTKMKRSFIDPFFCTNDKSRCDGMLAIALHDKRGPRLLSEVDPPPWPDPLCVSFSPSFVNFQTRRLTMDSRNHKVLVQEYLVWCDSLLRPFGSASLSTITLFSFPQISEWSMILTCILFAWFCVVGEECQWLRRSRPLWSS